MINKILFFSIDRLGDYLIKSNLIKILSNKYDQADIVCSEMNYKLLKSQKFFSDVIIFNTKKKKINKYIFIRKYFRKKYNSVIVFDGKNISNILLILIDAKFKFSFIFKKEGFLNNILLKIRLFIYNFFNIKYEILKNRALIEKFPKENYPKKIKKLGKYFKKINNKTYYLEKLSENKYINLKNSYILIHLDEKFDDIKNININFETSIIDLQKRINKKIYLTSFNNKFDYYRNLKIKKIKFKYLNNTILINSDIIIIENMPLDHFQSLIKNSFANISCHSGFFVHTSLCLKKNTIDIINKSDEIWLNAWIDEKNNYKKIYKSINNKRNNIEQITDQLNVKINR